MLWFRALCSSRVALVALTALVCTGVLAGIGLADVGGLATSRANTVDVVQQIHLRQDSGTPVLVNAGQVGEASASCDASHPYLSGGGYKAHGFHGLSVMSVVASYIEQGSPVHWLVRVVNPAGAGGPVSVTPYALCFSFQMVRVLAA
jgi:hypothetical protein